MKADIRRATVEDASAIARIARQADVAKIDAHSPRVRRILKGGRGFAAESRGELVGFVDGFLTAGSAGERRYELDLLAVAPGAQGRGIGGALMTAALAAASENDASEIRALARCQNEPMRRLCLNHGFSRSRGCFALLVAQPRPMAQAPLSHAAHLIAVDTLGYAGVWLEGEVSRKAIDAAHWLASQSGSTLIGALIPASDARATDRLQARGFRNVGDYHWWTLNRRSA